MTELTSVVIALTFVQEGGVNWVFVAVGLGAIVTSREAEPGNKNNIEKQ